METRARHTVAAVPEGDRGVVREALDLVLQLGRHDDSIVPAAKRVVLLCCDHEVGIKKDPELVASVEEGSWLPNAAAPDSHDGEARLRGALHQPPMPL